MRKTVNILTVILLAVLLINMLVMGLAVAELNTDTITVTAWITAACLIVLLPCLLYRTWTRSKCPHCGKMRLDGGEFCSWCGKKIAQRPNL